MDTFVRSIDRTVQWYRTSSTRYDNYLGNLHFVVRTYRIVPHRT